MHERIIFEKIKPGDVPGYRRTKMDLMEMRLGAARSEAACNAKVLAAYEKLDAAKHLEIHVWLDCPGLVVVAVGRQDT